MTVPRGSRFRVTAAQVWFPEGRRPSWASVWGRRGVRGGWMAGVRLGSWQVAVFRDPKEEAVRT